MRPCLPPQISRKLRAWACQVCLLYGCDSAISAEGLKDDGGHIHDAPLETAGCTSLQGLREHGLKAGDKLLVIGASGMIPCAVCARTHVEVWRIEVWMTVCI